MGRMRLSDMAALLLLLLEKRAVKMGRLGVAAVTRCCSMAGAMRGRRRRRRRLKKETFQAGYVSFENPNSFPVCSCF
jgi:hypothetical protein